jgi:phage shock protein C
MSINTDDKKLYRSKKNKVIAGVAGGLGDYFKIDPVVIRLIFVGVTLLGGGGVLVYLLIWLVVPAEGNKGVILGKETMEDNIREVGDTAKAYVDDFRIKAKKEHKNSRKFGWLLIIFGLVLLAASQGWLKIVDWDRLWPLVLVGAGVYYLAR